MILPDWMLTERLAADLVVTPLAPGAIQPSSLDLRLGPKVLVATADGHEEYDLSAGPLRIYQRHFVLGATLEHIEIPPDLVGVLVGKSSRAREGIQVEAAGYVDPGWRGNLTLEIVHLSPRPAWLIEGMLIAQLRIEQLAAACRVPYGAVGRYQDSTGPVASRAVVGRAS
jgi:dCTP deaminase